MEFPPGLLSNAPQLDTRRALLIIDLQNDFVETNGKLPIENVPEFIPAVAKLASRFREEGEVVWVQSVFEEPRPTLDPMTGSYSVLLKEFLPEDDTSTSSLDGYLESEGLTTTLKSLGTPVRSSAPTRPKPDPEAFLAQGISKANQCCMPGQPGSQLVPELAAAIDPERDIVSTKSQYGALTNNSLLLTLRVRLVTELYLCGSLSNIAVYATAVEAVTHGLKVTIIEDCVGYQDDRIHEEAMRQMADMMGAFGITSSELIDDLDGITSEEDEPAADYLLDARFRETAAVSTESLTLRPKVEDWIASVEQGDDKRPNEGRSKSLLGINGHVQTDDVEQKHYSLSSKEDFSIRNSVALDSLQSTSPPRKRSISEVDFQYSNLKSNTMLSDGQGSQDLADTIDRTEVTNQVRSRPRKSSKSKHISVDEDLVQRRTSKVLLPDECSTPNNLQSLSHDTAAKSAWNSVSICRTRKAAKLLLGPEDRIGEGDCQIIYDLIPEDEAQDFFTKLNQEVQWQKMYHRSGEVPRLVAVQGQVGTEGSTPIYRHPADESPQLLPFTPTISAIRTEAENVVGHSLNHVLIQLYRNGEDSISEHSDKTLDIVQSSKVVNYSAGARRTMTLRTKKISKDAVDISTTLSKDLNPNTPEAPREIQRVPLPHNSLFVLGPETNMAWLHSIRPDKRPSQEKVPEELAYDEARISLTFRRIGTYLNTTTGTIWGQGATSKTEREARPIRHGYEAKVEELVRAFGQENHQGKNFDWEKWYGQGFDVVNFITKEREGTVELTT